MVKQFLTILLLFVYSFSSVGATVKAHLCAGKVQKCLCGKASKTKSTTKDTCCAEKISFVKHVRDNKIFENYPFEHIGFDEETTSKLKELGVEPDASECMYKL